jgi:2-hydroxycyclohexanecarboxyl-CoA dehydrogenase
MKLLEKVAIITGAGRGIGRSIALKLAQEGAKVVVTDMNEESVKEVADEIQKNGQTAMSLKVDITIPKDINEMVQKTLSEFKVIDILINNAGWDKVENFVDSTEETWDKVIAINLKGPIQCFKAVLPHMISRQYGKILSISSDAGRVGSSGEAVYSACKGGIIAFTKTLARETARYKINVNCIAPGPTDTPILEIIADQPKILEGMKRSIPFRRLAKPEDIANAVAFFVSDEAEFITGQTLSVSGGLTMI